MADDHDALLARADTWLSSPPDIDKVRFVTNIHLVIDLAAALRAAHQHEACGHTTDPALPDDGLPESWPDRMEMVRELRRATGLFDGAIPVSAKVAWDEAIAKVRDLQADRTAGLDVIARLTTGWDHRQMPLGREWYRDPFLVDEPTSEPMSDREWRVFCDAAQRATRTTT
jgi:hypothetical protein